MSKIALYNEQPMAVTTVPNIFIDEYMAQANGEYVKIYLYLLRSMNRLECSFSLSQIADHFDCTERDVLRALKYWEKLHLLRLEYDSSRNLSGICFLTDHCHDVPSVTEDAPSDAASRFVRATAADNSCHTAADADNLQDFCKKDDVRELVFIAEQYLGRTLNQTDLNTIFFWYDEFGFSAELIGFLIENCVDSGHTSLRYMQKIAEEYAAREIHTVEEARLFTSQNSAVYYAVMKSFGIRGRSLIPSEMNYLKQWSGSLGFSVDMISEACTRTIRAIHEPSFGYANTILQTWHDQGIHTIADVKKSDEAYRQTQSQRTKRTQGNPPGTVNRFINFRQRENNYDEIQKHLVQNSLQ
ncbi:MAG: DnaD domain protein [Lachnospiraceae bacterium]|nr:DnaD domain protein [Lachnospiraceae bacterium]